MAEEWAYKDEAKAFDETDFDLSTLRRSDVRVAREPKSSLAVRFDAADIDRLRQVADAKGKGVTQLVREWVLERLDEPEAGGGVTDLINALEEALRVARVVKRTKSGRQAG